MCCFFFCRYVEHHDLHVLTHSFPTRRSSDLNGNLVGAAYMKESEGFVQKECRLPSIHLEVWRGNIFINFAAQPVPFAEAIADLEKDFEPLHMENCRPADLMHMEPNCNWRFQHGRASCRERVCQ